MKTNHILATFILIIFLSNKIIAQPGANHKSIGFGGPSFLNTTLAGEWAFETGGMGAGFVSQNVYVGGGGFGITQKKDGYEYTLGYGGPMLGYQLDGGKKTDLHCYVFNGYGVISEKGEGIPADDDGIWIVKPAIEVDFQILNWLRIGVGGGFRWVIGSNISTLRDKDLSGPFSSITFRFGNWK